MAQELFNSQDWISAADRGDAEAVASLLAAGVGVDERTQGSETALMRAAARGHAPLVRVLLERGADPNLRRRDGWTALMLAAFFGHAETARELLRGGADPEAADRNGSTAFKWASSRGHVEVARLLNDTAPPAPANEKAQADADTSKETKPAGPTPPTPPAESAPEINAAVMTATTPTMPTTATATTPTTPMTATPGAATRVEPADGAREELDEVTIAAAVTRPAAAHVAATTPASAPVSTQAHSPAPVLAHAPAPPDVSIFERGVESRAEKFVVSPEVRREVSEAAARAARGADGGARFWRAAALGMALLAVCGAVAAYKFGGAGAPPAGDGARGASTPEAAQQPAAAAPVEAQPAVPITPMATPLPTDPAAQGLGTVGLVPGAQPSVPTYFPPAATTGAATTPPPVEGARPRETYPANQPGGRAAGGEPAVVNLGQSERAADDTPATTRRPQDSGAANNARGETPPTRTARDDSELRSARPARPADELRPAPTPKGKVVNWP